MKKNAPAKGIEAIFGTKRAAMILLHPTALPDPEGATYGVGELGSEAFRFVDFLESAGVLAWQTLPLGHTGYGDSPYQTFSRSAGSPYLISVEKLRDAGDLSQEQHDDYVARARKHGPPREKTDFGWLYHHKLGAGFDNATAILRWAFETFRARPENDPRRAAFDAFCRENADAYSGWLNDYAEYMALKECNGQRCWADWPAEFREAASWRERREELLAQNPNLEKTIVFYQYLQFVFFEQWDALRNYARERGRIFVGDIPWYVGYDSADVWAHRAAFELDANGAPLAVAGVPPDYFSATGQLWGNPLYDWSRTETFEWWVDAVAFLLSKVDVLRMDHFRAADTYWKISYEWASREHTAREGCWAKTPGLQLLGALHQRLEREGRKLADGQLPIIAEDLGGLDPLYATPESYPRNWDHAKRFRIERAFQHLLEAEREKALETESLALEKKKHRGKEASPESSDRSDKPDKSDGASVPLFSPAVGQAFNARTGEYNTRKGVDVLLEEFGLPRMEVLQFGLEGSGPGYNSLLGPECVLYTGTHDNDTALGWYRSHAQHRIREAVENDRAPFRPMDPLGKPLEVGHVTALRDVPWEMIEMVLEARPAVAALPLQDLLGLGSEARMNRPGDQAGGWWVWRVAPDLFDASHIARRLNALLRATRRAA